VGGSGGLKHIEQVYPQPVYNEALQELMEVQGRRAALIKVPDLTLLTDPYLYCIV
jgi:hypothetical protein